MKTYRYDFDFINLYNLGDIHYGSYNCDRAMIKKMVKKIQNEENSFWVSTGDILDVAIKSSISHQYDNLSLDKEMEEMIKIFEPIKDKCLGIVGSNHHNRIKKEIGLHLDKYFCKLAGLPYLGQTGYIRVVVKNVGYYIAMHHGIGAGRTRGAKANNLRLFGNVVVGYDIYLTGHTHSFTHFIDVIPILDKKHLTNMYLKTHFITTGHYLNWNESYAEEKLLAPAPKGSSVVILNGGLSNKNKKIDVMFVGLEELRSIKA